MLWRMHNVQGLHSKKNLLYDALRLTAAYQNYDESRIDRTRASSTRNIQAEKVNAVSINIDADKCTGCGVCFEQCPCLEQRQSDDARMTA